jgi:hypothetical protein
MVLASELEVGHHVARLAPLWPDLAITEIRPAGKVWPDEDDVDPDGYAVYYDDKSPDYFAPNESVLIRFPHLHGGG